MEIQLDDELRVLARKAVLEEITFRMTKLWRIFSWTSTILVAITGGVIAIRTGEQVIKPVHQYLIAAAALTVGLYAVIWLRQNLKLEAMARDALSAHDNALGIQSYNYSIGGGLPRPDVKIIVGYKITVALLTIAAVTASLIDLNYAP